MQIADAWPFQARNQFRCFDSQPLLLTHFEIVLRASVELTVCGGTILFSEEFTGWKKLEMWMCLGQPAVALVSFTFSMFNTKYAAISQGDSPSLIGELREKCKLTWRAMKESLIKLKKILMCCYHHNILSCTGTWYPFLSVSGIESYIVVA